MKLTETSKSEEGDVAEYDNYTSGETESESFNNDFDIDILPLHNVQCIKSKNGKRKGKLDPIPHSGRLPSTIIIQTTPDVTRYATGRITDIKCDFTLFFPEYKDILINGFIN